jgi:hypothetical protein
MGWVGVVETGFVEYVPTGVLHYVTVCITMIRS